MCFNVFYGCKYIIIFFDFFFLVMNGFIGVFIYKCECFVIVVFVMELNNYMILII